MLRRNAEASPFEMLPGIVRRVLNHGERMMLVELYMAEGSHVPEHRHHHEQIGYLARGRLRFRVADETKELEQGDSWLIPADVPHEVHVLEDTVALDIFSPIREDFLQP